MEKGVFTQNTYENDHKIIVLYQIFIEKILEKFKKI
jgi:hypothetical protein